MQIDTASDTDEEHQHNQLPNAKQIQEQHRLCKAMYNQKKQHQNGQYQHYHQPQQQDQCQKPIRHQQTYNVSHNDVNNPMGRNQFKPMLSQEELDRQRQLKMLAEKAEQSLTATRKGNRRSMKHEDNVRTDPSGKVAFRHIPDGPGVSQIPYQRSELHQSQPLDTNCNRLQKSQQRRDQSSPSILRFSEDENMRQAELQAMLLDDKQHMKGDVRPKHPSEQDNPTLRPDARGQYRHRHDPQIAPASPQLQPPEPAMDKHKHHKKKSKSSKRKRTSKAEHSNVSCLLGCEQSNMPTGGPQLQPPDPASDKLKEDKNKNKSSGKWLWCCMWWKHESTTKMANAEPDASTSLLTSRLLTIQQV